MADSIEAPAGVRFSRNPHGQLCVTLPDGTLHEGVVPVRSFPIQAPLEGISLVGSDGKEVLWLEHLDDLAPEQRTLLEEEFAVRELVPVIEHILHVDSISVPSHWDVTTDRGQAVLVLKAEEDIRRLSPTHLLITSREGVQYRIPDLTQLDRQSLKRLERFL
jgi:hypothetical protein